jgi:saccharopine dehydrogenase-like NADP-dependent oxidoreductase
VSRFAVVGVGTTGSHVVRQLAASALDLLEVVDLDPARAGVVARAVPYAPAQVRSGLAEVEASTVVLTTPAGSHLDLARDAVRAGRHVVSVSDSLDDVEALIELDTEARRAGVCVAVGAGFSPGLSCILARHAVEHLDVVDEIRVARAGTGGPACARHHHEALTGTALEWFGGQPQRRRGGTGRELAWFPDPIGALDCYRAAVASPLLLHRAFPEVDRITARFAATRRDRLTAWMPMLRPPHRDGGPGAVRVEVRGLRHAEVSAVIYGVMDHPSVAAAMVAAMVAARIEAGELPVGARGLAEMVEPVGALDELSRRGLRAAAFDGVAPI